MSSKKSTGDSGNVGKDSAFALLVADIYEAAGVLRRLGERSAAVAGQTQARWQVLSVISNGDWTVPMTADRLGTSRQAVQRIANELVDDGLASFADNPRHRRSQLLQITDDGHRVLDAITVGAGSVNAALLNDARGIDVDAVRSALRQLTVAVRTRIQGSESGAKDTPGSPGR